ncbi:unnamed protein product [Cylindrotheca closterium]|uniref:Rhodanese domain-containing protein n=1 Tax=Cylindrotheca closterium TaxID=2856 RepID=A0AAD2FDX0_9STRA|nr:unnamed protein product [Cylindrotheca closterium]
MSFASAAAIRKSLQKPSTILVDVRTGLEAMISGKIEVEGHKTYQSSFVSSIAKEWDRDTDIIVYCASGARSAGAKGTLEGMGFKTVLNGGGYSDMKSMGF